MELSSILVVLESCHQPHDMPVPNAQWKTPDDGHRNCAKHVEFLDKNKFGKLVRLLVLFKKTNESF